MAVSILGIRHHGPGSARAVKAFLEEQKPDIVLVEGPPEGDELLPWVLSEELKPPVALLLYNPEAPQQASFYPFAEFSPEWQAILYAQRAGIPIRFMDLPAAHGLALTHPPTPAAEPALAETPPDNTPLAEPTETVELTETADAPLEDPTPVPEIVRDPISYLAEAAGWESGEQWWEHQFEQRSSTEAVFEAVAEAMTALREELPAGERETDAIREAWMRRVIRKAESEMFTNIAIVCGAWHVPALTTPPPVKADNELLKSLPKVKVEATWVPWTYNRLSVYSNYGAGIHSPGWYHHIWHYPADDGTRWLSGVAGLLRRRGIDASVADVIEGVRLAANLAALRGFSKPGLPEMNEAALSILCGGDEVLLRLIHEELIVSDRIGTVPEKVPHPPLQADINKHAKRLRLAQTASQKDYMLDLRKDLDLERSVFLHRLKVLQIDWGQSQRADGRGTFKEAWQLQWTPELSISIIEKGIWGNTLETAATAYAVGEGGPEASLSTVVALLQSVIPADLSLAISQLAKQLNNKAASSPDVLELVKVIPGLTKIIRYGDVRKTDAAMVLPILENIFIRVCIGLPVAVISINEEEAKAVTTDCSSVQGDLALLQQEDFTTQWQECLWQIVGNTNSAARVRGFAGRQLMNDGLLQGEDLYGMFSRSTSPALPPVEVSTWLEGFLGGSGTVLLLDAKLWKLVDDWVGSLNEEAFIQTLPLLRRTFSAFSPAERRKLGEKVKSGAAGPVAVGSSTSTMNSERAERAIPILKKILGLNAELSNQHTHV
jgi:hypothetical protein